MVFSYVLILTAVCIVVKADSKTTNDIRKEIAQTQQKTNATLIQYGQVAEAVKQLEAEIQKSKRDIDARSLNLTIYETHLVYKMYSLNVTATTIEQFIKHDTKLVKELEHVGYRLDFIIQLLREDIQILFERRKNGDENTCYQIVGSYVPFQVALATNSINNSEVHEMGTLGVRSGIILVQELNLAKIKLFAAQRELLLEEQLFESKKEYYNTLTSTGIRLLEQLADYVKEAEGVIEKLERYINYLKTIEADLYKQLIEVRQLKKPKFDEINRLQKELAGYKRATSCYAKLENDF